MLSWVYMHACMCVRVSGGAGLLLLFHTSVHLCLNIHSYQRFPSSSHSCIPDVLLLVYKFPSKGHMLRKITHCFLLLFLHYPTCLSTFLQPTTLFPKPQPGTSPSPVWKRPPETGASVCASVHNAIFIFFTPCCSQLCDRIRRSCFEMGICRKPLYGILK